MSCKNNALFILFTITVFIGLVVPALVSDGMFMDGILYATVSKNLANGYGSFWFPKFSETWLVQGLNTFHEHPPLVFGIQSLFFRILGNSMYVERFYSFLTSCLMLLLILLNWSLIFRENENIKKLGWMPILFWIITPECFWGARNNVMENTMGLFTLLASYFVLKALWTKSRVLLNMTIGGVFIFLSTFSKGAPGLFPLFTVFVYWLVHKDIPIMKVILYSMVLLMIPVIIYGLLILNDSARTSLSFYFFERLLNRVQTAPTVVNRFHVVRRLFEELLPVIGVTGIVILILKQKEIKLLESKGQVKAALTFLIMGVMGSFPLLLTMVQKGFYLLPSFPFFALGFATCVAPGISRWMERVESNGIFYKIFSKITIVLLLGVIAYSVLQIGKYSRSRKMLHDVYAMGNIIEKPTTVTISQTQYTLNWYLQCYFMRYFNISMGYKEKYPYLIVNKNEKLPYMTDYSKVDIITQEYDLYSLK